MQSIRRRLLLYLCQLVMTFSPVEMADHILTNQQTMSQTVTVAHGQPAFRLFNHMHIKIISDSLLQHLQVLYRVVQKVT